MEKLKNKHVLITGATSGIGYELTKLFAKDGYNLILVARTQSDLEKVAAELKQSHSVDVITICKDLFKSESAFQIHDELQAKGIQVGTLVNNAGQGEYGEFIDTDLRKELSIIQLNISSVVALTKLFLQNMITSGEGRILNLSSIAGKAPGPWQAVYHGTKAFIQSFTEAIRYEVKDKGIVVTALLPGATDTDFFNKANMTESKIVQDESKLADPADVAKDGYEALMKGDDMVVSGMKNKIQVAMGGVTADDKLAAKMAKQQEPVEKHK